MCASFAFGFEGGMWDLVVLVPDQCLSFYFLLLLNILAIRLIFFLYQTNGTFGAAVSFIIF